MVNLRPAPPAAPQTLLVPRARRRPTDLPPGVLADLPEVRVAGVGLTLLPVVTVLHRLDIDAAHAVALVALVVAVAAIGLPLGHALLLGLTGWAMVTGFVVHHLGQLVLAPPDLLRLALFVSVGAAAALLSARRSW